MTGEVPVRCWIGLDDTDGPDGGCTTHDFDDLLRVLEDAGFIIDDARLVRLWPFAPERTRGNAAVAAQVHGPAGSRGDFDSKVESWFASLERRNGAEPFLHISQEQPEEAHYWRAVRGFVDDGRGLVGARAAMAWRGGNDHTWELTAYRQPCNIGKDRNVAEVVVEEMVREFGTMLNRDPTKGRGLIAPRTPCPVLYGIRGESKRIVRRCHAYLQSKDVEPSSHHRVWRTNQATGDHLERVHKDQIVSKPDIRAKGHVILQVEGKTLLAFQASGPVAKLAQTLHEGDQIEWMGLEAPDGTYHLERLRLVKGARNRMRPLCECGSRMKSLGRNQGLRCPSCGSLEENRWECDWVEHDWVEPPASERRHLAKPLSRTIKSEAEQPR